jgi:hypothetical protein
VTEVGATVVATVDATVELGEVELEAVVCAPALPARKRPLTARRANVIDASLWLIKSSCPVIMGRSWARCDELVKTGQKSERVDATFA